MLSVQLTYVSPPSLSLTPLLLCLLPPSPLLFLLLLSSSAPSFPSLSLTPFTQMLPAAQLDRSDGMCQLGITPLPTFLHCKQGDWLGGKDYFGIKNKKT